MLHEDLVKSSGVAIIVSLVPLANLHPVAFVMHPEGFHQVASHRPSTESPSQAVRPPDVAAVFVVGRSRDRLE